MNWSDERYVSLYTSDTGDWMALSFDAQSLLMHLLRKCDRSGIIELGKRGKRSIAVMIGHASIWERLAPAVDELLVDGCIEVHDDKLLVRNHLEAQNTPQSDRVRKEESRIRRRDLTMAKESGTLPLVTNRDRGSRNVTESHERSHAVTNGHSDQNTPQSDRVRKEE